MSRRQVKILIEITTEFESYDNDELNELAFQDIREYVEESFDVLGYIPLYVEKNEHGSWIEDSTSEVKTKVLKAHARPI